ncbi:hypothetical protein F892_03099 [Acinetobacter vivianii]|uniref:Phage protein n=1 Tax=Acinetobacter vivianii TaxID=1776742 RepID=N9PR67_9GAMM|nr:hypothetical protein [Acinetobacter vivianii]ENX20176.1 hypothetical protein F892_03099 [Acinetobacter vivianii]GGI59376.1 hypothetical protein GCM10011446_08710 [Acinetobacter vivianii]
MSDLDKARREGTRWLLLISLNRARPIGCSDAILLDVVNALYPRTTVVELHSQLEYLQNKKLVEIDRKPDGHWNSKLNSEGIDVVEYTTECPPGIARPAKYWEGN